MRSFRAVICGLLVAAGSIIALPIVNNPRSLSSASSIDAIVARAIDVKFALEVPKGERESIKAQDIVHHSSIPDGHTQKAAISARSEDVHLDKLARRELVRRTGGASSSSTPKETTAEDFKVTFTKKVPEGEHQAIKQQIITYLKSLPDGDIHRTAVSARVWRGFHLTPGEEDKGQHATVNFYSASQNSKHTIDGSAHIYKRAV